MKLKQPCWTCRYRDWRIIAVRPEDLEPVKYGYVCGNPSAPNFKFDSVECQGWRPKG